MDYKQLSSLVKEQLLGIKQKQFPFQSFTKKLGQEETAAFIKYLLKYAYLKYDQLEEYEAIIMELKDSIKKKEIEQAEYEMKLLQEKLDKLKS